MNERKWDPWDGMDRKAVVQWGNEILLSDNLPFWLLLGRGGLDRNRKSLS